MFQRKIHLSESELFLIRWHKDWSNLSIKLNTTEIGSFPDKAALEMGKWLPLPNGKTVLVRLVKNELEIWDGNNELVSGLKSGESDYFTTAWKGLIAYGILFIIYSMTIIYFNDYDIEGGAFSLFSFIGLIGLIYIALALWARKKQDKMAYYIAAARMLAYTFFLTTSSLSAQGSDYDTKQWTELTSLDKTIQLDLRYATSNNFVKAKMYDCGRCFLRPEAAKAIAKAHKVLKDKGYGGFKMFDCYRPKPYQARLWAKLPDSRFVMPPWKGSQHTRGLAVDITIVDKNGNELDMGTPFDTFTEKAYSTYQKLPKNVLENRKLLRGVMAQVGFKGIRTEWWHFSFQNAKYGLSEWVWECQ